MGVVGPDTVASHQAADGTWRPSYPDPGCLQMRISGSGKSNANYWELQGITWEDLGVPAGGLVSEVQGWHDWRVSEYAGGAQGSTGALQILTGDGSTIIATLLSGNITFSGTGSWATRSSFATQAVAEQYRASSTAIRIRLHNNLATAAGGTAVTLRHDHIDLDVVYEPATVFGDMTGADDTLSGSASALAPAAGTLAVTDGADAISASASTVGTGNLSVTPAGDSLSSTTSAIAGADLDATGQDDTTAGQAQAVATGSATPTGADDQVAGAASVDTIVSIGDLSATGAADTASGSATAQPIAALEYTNQADQVVANGSAWATADTGANEAGDTLNSLAAALAAALADADESEDTLIATALVDTIVSIGDLDTEGASDALDATAAVALIPVVFIGDLELTAADDSIEATALLGLSPTGGLDALNRDDFCNGRAWNVGVDVPVYWPRLQSRPADVGRLRNQPDPMYVKSRPRFPGATNPESPETETQPAFGATYGQ